VSHPVIVTLLYAGTGLMFSLMSIPFIQERVAPNAFFGFRTSKTLSDPDVWYQANRIMGYDLLIAGLVIALGSVIVLLLSLRYPALPLVKVNLGIFVISLLLVAIHGYWRLNRL
jgi:uncharacterized membrane protein